MEGAENSERGRRDRISNLPDCLLHVIMSFMTPQEAVQTCVLSKRWKNFWTTLPYLNFEFLLIEQMDDDEEGYHLSFQFERFRHFVGTFLLLRESSDLHTFRLSCFDLLGYNMSITSWIQYALKHNPEVLNIKVPEELPIGGVFSCLSLEDVSITVGWEPSVKFVNLPRLKWLYLEYICLNQDFVSKLFCGCPVIESLHLKCILKFSTINSRSLKYLSIDSWCLEMSTEIELINAPNLLSFYLTSCPLYLGHKILLNLPSLTNASIYTNGCLHHQFYKGESNILTGISNVENLKLIGSVVKDILESRCPMFPNLKDLHVEKLCLSYNFSLLATLLDHSPNFEKLSLIHCGCQCQIYKDHGNQELMKITPFQCKQLTMGELKFCKQDKDFPRIVKYLQDGLEKSRARINMSTFMSPVIVTHSFILCNCQVHKI